MKRTLVAILVALITFSAPAYAGGFYRKAPQSHSHHDHDHDVADGLAFLVKLPFRLVTSTTLGLAGIVVNQDLEGFERGYELI